MYSTLTRFVVRLVHGTACDGTERLTLLDEPTLVYTYRSPDPPLAQVTPFGTILWNSAYTDRLSPSARRVVLRHECSHRDRNPLFKVVFAVAMGLFGIGLLCLVEAGVLLARGAYADGTLLGLLGLGLLVGAVVVSRVEEGLADYHALREVGETRFLDAYEEIESLLPSASTGRLVSRLFYPDRRTVVRVHRLVERARDDPPVGLLYSLLRGSARNARR